MDNLDAFATVSDEELLSASSVTGLGDFEDDRQVIILSNIDIT